MTNDGEIHMRRRAVLPFTPAAMHAIRDMIERYADEPVADLARRAVVDMQTFLAQPNRDDLRDG